VISVACVPGAMPCATFATTEEPTGDPNADPNRDLDGDGTADECEGAGAGSRCDVFTQKCTLPYAARQVRTIPWYVAGDTSLFDPTNWATVEWDLALKTAVQTARLVECRKTGGSNCDQTYPMWKGQQDDNDEGVRIARDVDTCHRTQGWDAQACTDLASSEAAAVAGERGGADSSSTLAIVVTDTLEKIVKVNPAFTRITGFAMEEVLGSDPRGKVISLEHDLAFFTRVGDTLRTKGRWEGEVTGLRRSGESFPAWLSMTTVSE